MAGTGNGRRIRQTKIKENFMKKLFLAIVAVLLATTLQAKAKELIVYYSYSGNTRTVAEAIRAKTKADIFEIKVKENYSDDYHTMTRQARDQIEQGYRPELTDSIAGLSEYDTIFLCSPNWWSTIALAVSSFLDNYDLSGKKIIPVITHGGYGVQNTIKDMTAQCNGCNVEQNGWVGENADTTGLDEWLSKVRN